MDRTHTDKQAVRTDEQQQTMELFNERIDSATRCADRRAQFRDKPSEPTALENTPSEKEAGKTDERKQPAD